MRIHTTHPDAVATAQRALNVAQAAGLVAPGVYFDKAKPGRSMTHKSAADVHMVTDTKEPGDKRRRPNSGQYGYDGTEAWAATWDEWGWFLSALFVLDPGAKAAPYYPTRDAFHAATSGKFLPVRAGRAAAR